MFDFSELQDLLEESEQTVNEVEDKTEGEDGV